MNSHGVERRTEADRCEIMNFPVQMLEAGAGRNFQAYLILSERKLRFEEFNMRGSSIKTHSGRNILSG